MEILIRREFANDEEITAMFEEELWKSHFVSSIAKDTFNHMVNNGRNLRTAAEYASIDFFTRTDQQYNHWDLKSHPRLFTWTITILTKWENQVGRQDNNFHERIANAFANAFEANTEDMRKSWKDFEDFDRLTEFLLTQRTSSAVSILKHLPTNTDVRMPNRILVAAQNVSPSLSFELIPLLNDYLTKRHSFSNNDIEVTFKAISIWLDLFAKDQKASIDKLTHTIDLLAKDKNIGLNDPRIQMNVGLILQSKAMGIFRSRFTSQQTWMERTPGCTQYS